jgi:hypothetical protein
LRRYAVVYGVLRRDSKAEWEVIKPTLTPEQKKRIKGHAFLRGKRRMSKDKADEKKSD